MIKFEIQHNNGCFDVYVNGTWAFTRTSWLNVTYEIGKILRKWKEENKIAED